jgi:glucose-1-phosphate thymidylyltransferase
MYLDKNELNCHILPRGSVWFDTGTPDSLMEAAALINMIQNHQNIMIASPHEIAYNNGWISDSQLKITHDICSKTKYGEYLFQLLAEKY